MMKPNYTLEISQDQRVLFRVPLDSPEITIGRDAGNRVVLPDPIVSKRHATLALTDGRFTIVDLESAQGTVVRGTTVTRAAVDIGEFFQIGSYQLRVVTEVPEAPAPGVPRTAAAGEPQTTEVHHLVKGLASLTKVVGISDLQLMLESLLERTMALLIADQGFIIAAGKRGLAPLMVRRGSDATRPEGYSRTVCKQAMTEKKPIVLSSLDDQFLMESIASLKQSAPAWVVAIPLMYDDDVLGGMYLEGPQILKAALRDQTTLLNDISEFGGRTLRAALDRQQLVNNNERWRWLANSSGEEVDLTRTCLSPRMQDVMGIVERLATEDVTALILGESGTGKEVVCQAIHKLSPRASNPFIAVNCGAIPRDLIEGELFGYEKGAYTGATSRKLGRFELAQGGTLLLDEIGDLPKDLQVKLLRVLETRSFERLGGEQAIRLDVRILAATHRDLEAAIQTGEFRHDLYYRLNVVSLELPPLRERLEDLDALVSELLLGANRRFRRKLYGVTPEALAAMRGYAWPGNIRELRNVIERAFILEKGDVMTLTALPFKSRPADRVMEEALPRKGGPTAVPSMAEYVRAREREYARFVIDQAGGSLRRAAEMAGLTRSAFYKKLRALGLREKGTGTPADD